MLFSFRPNAENEDVVRGSLLYSGKRTLSRCHPIHHLGYQTVDRGQGPQGVRCLPPEVSVTCRRYATVAEGRAQGLTGHGQTATIVGVPSLGEHTSREALPSPS